MASNLSHNGGGPGHPWFLGAPLSKLVCLSVAAAFIMIELKKAHDPLSVDLDKIINGGQYYRLFTGHAAFGTGGECIMGTGVLSMLMRRFEREMGTRKMSSFLILVGLVAVGLEIALSQVLALNIVYSGPYPWLGALFWLFHCYTPRIHPRFFGILGFHFSEKSITYAFCLQVICVGWVTTLLPVACGAVAGYLCSTPKLFFSKVEFPDFVCGVFEAMGERVVEDPPPLVAAPGFGRTRARQRQQPLMAPRGPVVPVRRPSPPPESMIEQLTSMGFEREAVLRALRQTNNNVERAADRLLMGA